MMQSTRARWLIAGIAVFAALAVLVLAAGAFWAGHLAAQRYASTNSGWNGGGMMGGRDARGMMGWNGGGMMGGYGYSSGVDAPGQGSLAGNGLTVEQARQAVERYIAATGNPDLVLDEVMEFQFNFYAIVRERSTGIGAFEVLVDRSSGVVSPEPGPNMMWNARYGMMSGRGMMGGYGMMGGGFTGSYTQAGSTMAISPAQAASIGQRWLDQNLPGVQVHADDVDPFYGYYTLHVWKDGQVYGMLSVNGASGQVWYHTWHGTFVTLLEG